MEPIAISCLVVGRPPAILIAFQHAQRRLARWRHRSRGPYAGEIKRVSRLSVNVHFNSLRAFAGSEGSELVTSVVWLLADMLQAVADVAF